MGRIGGGGGGGGGVVVGEGVYHCFLLVTIHMD